MKAKTRTKPRPVGPQDEPARPAEGWRDALSETLEAVRALLQRAAGGADGSGEALVFTSPSPLAHLQQLFGLSDFETGVLALAAAVELLPGVDKQLAALDGAAARGYPTFGHALAFLPGGHWDALTPAGPLRLRRLVSLGDGDVLTERPVRIEERVLHALMGVDALDPRVVRRVRPLEAPPTLPPSHERAAAALERSLMASPETPIYLAAELGRDALAVAARAGARRRWQVYALDGAALPPDPADREELVRLWQREAVLGRLFLVVDLDGCLERASERAALDFALRLQTPLVLAGREALPPQDRPLVRLEVPATSFEERLQLWEETLGDLPRPTADELGTLAAQFRGDASVVRGAVAELRAARNAGDEPAPGALLWEACRSQARPRLGTLAQRVISDVQLRDVILPETQRRMLDAVLVQVRHKARVHHEWGFAAGESRGQGVSAVFAGPSGTGKTMAAEAIARELSLDLYRVDLSSVVSKYIGETEQNLRRVFDAAEAGGGVLLFDEADALFGKRTEVKDSHDRHANIEVSYLLQRMEAYGGLAILTTNLRKNMDDAFFRRIPFVIDFPFPDSELREQIWRGIFPASAPVEGILYPKLAQLPVAGGNIRSIARNAAFLGAADGGRITMKQLLEATRLEYAKLGRSLPPEEIRGWV